MEDRGERETQKFEYLDNEKNHLVNKRKTTDTTFTTEKLFL